MRLSVLSATLAVICAGCGGESPSEPRNSQVRLGVWAPGPAATILHSDVSGLESETFVVVDDRNTWQTLWTQTWAGTANPPPLPQIDFVLDAVVVAALGRRGGSGYWVSLDSVVATTAGSLAYATTTRPGAGCNPGGVASSPVHMVHFPGHPPVIDWRISNSLRPCT